MAPQAPPSGQPPTNRSTGSGDGRNRSPSLTAECSCGAQWGGLLTAHCSGCHRTYTGLTAFDRHRDGSHARSTRHCRDPWDVGLVDANRAYSCWGFPSDGGEWWK